MSHGPLINWLQEVVAVEGRLPRVCVLEYTLRMYSQNSFASFSNSFVMRRLAMST